MTATDVTTTNVTITDVIAVVAIVVSVLTAWASQASARKTAKRQQTFELRFYRLSMLDPAKGKLRRILIDIDRASRLAATAPQSLEELVTLDREVVNTFHAISHHLPFDSRAALGARRAALERKWVQESQQQSSSATFEQEMVAYAEEVLQAVEDRLQALLDGAPNLVSSTAGPLRIASRRASQAGRRRSRGRG